MEWYLYCLWSFFLKLLDCRGQLCKLILLVYVQIHRNIYSLLNLYNLKVKLMRNFFIIMSFSLLLNASKQCWSKLCLRLNLKSDQNQMFIFCYTLLCGHIVPTLVIFGSSFFLSLEDTYVSITYFNHWYQLQQIILT